MEDTNALDRMLSLLMQAASSSKISTTDETGQVFTIKDKFAPAQKNETQLRFKKTCADPGRKAKARSMKYVQLIACVQLQYEIVLLQVPN